MKRKSTPHTCGCLPNVGVAFAEFLRTNVGDSLQTLHFFYLFTFLFLDLLPSLRWGEGAVLSLLSVAIITEMEWEPVPLLAFVSVISDGEFFFYLLCLSYHSLFIFFFVWSRDIMHP